MKLFLSSHLCSETFPSYKFSLCFRVPHTLLEKTFFYPQLSSFSFLLMVISDSRTSWMGIRKRRVSVGDEFAVKKFLIKLISSRYLNKLNNSAPPPHVLICWRNRLYSWVFRYIPDYCVLLFFDWITWISKKFLLHFIFALRGSVSGKKLSKTCSRHTIFSRLYTWENPHIKFI